MLTFCSRMVLRPYAFATAVTRDALDYYRLLDVHSGATQQAIRESYFELTQNLRPELDTLQFKTLNEAYIILTDSKTRDAYDSLLAVRKSFYLSPDEARPLATRSFLSERKLSKEEEIKKKINIDEFGRYKGGLPRQGGKLRGNSRGETGTMFRQVEVEEELDPHPEFNTITKEKAESFKNFHQDERKARTMKWPWFTFEVDYGYFSFRTFRKNYWPKFQLLVLFFYILPTLYYAFESFEKKAATAKLVVKGLKAKQVEAAPEAAPESA